MHGKTRIGTMHKTRNLSHNKAKKHKYHKKQKNSYKFKNLNLFNFQKNQKSTKKLKFRALLKQFFYFVPRGTNVENFFVSKV